MKLQYKNKNISIYYMDEIFMGSKFGCALFPNLIYIREDLPNIVKEFILVHELYHLFDPTKNWILRELKANWAGACSKPIGFIVTCWLSCFSIKRIRYYISRFKEKK